MVEQRIARSEAQKEAEFSITIKGARSREAALSTILDMIKPEGQAAMMKIAESPNGLKQDGDVFTLGGWVCCLGENYYTCGDDGVCVIMGEGCPA